jgi:hypothetical protein
MNGWVLKTHPGSVQVDCWLRFLAEGVVAIGWEDIDVNPSQVEDDRLKNALRRAYPDAPNRKRNYPYLVKQIRQFQRCQEGDMVLLCRGYPGNGNSPVHVYGFATVSGPFFDDATSDWWRFKHRAEIQVVDGKLGRKRIASALGLESLRHTIHSVAPEALRRVAQLCRDYLDSPLTLY